MKIAMLFPGYGTQHVGMGALLYEEYPTVRKYFDEASDHAGVDFKKLCFSSSALEINFIEKAYPSIYVLSCAISKLLQEHGIVPTVVAGYDTGYYAALQAVQGITFIEGLDALKKYAVLYALLLKNNDFDMIDIGGLTPTKLPEFLDHRVFIASYLSRTQHIVAGLTEGIENVREKLKGSSSATIHDEAIGIGLHSELMNPVAQKFIPHIRAMQYKNTTIPLISSHNGALITDHEQSMQECITLMTHPIRWSDVIDQLVHVDLVVGIGMHPDLLNVVIEKYPNKHVHGMNNVRDLQDIKQLIV